MYDLSSTEPTVRYLHGAAGFPTKATWLKVIHKGNYQSWPLVNSKNVNISPSESEETQKGHMRGKRQGERSTKEKATTQEASATQKPTNQINSGGPSQPNLIKVPLEKRKDIFIAVYKPRDTIYTDQTGKFPHTSSQGHNYQMLIHEINRNSTWVETMKNKTQGEMIK